MARAPRPVRVGAARWAIPAVVVAAALATGIDGAGGAAAPAPAPAGAEAPPARPVAAAERSLAPSVWRRLDPGRRDRALAALTPEQARRLEKLLDLMTTGGRVPVASEGRVVGYVDATAVMNRPEVPAARTVMAPVTDTTGRLVGYWGGPLGVVERGAAEAPGFDPPGLAVRRGLNRDGTAGTELVRRLPGGAEPPRPGAVRHEPAERPGTTR